MSNFDDIWGDPDAELQRRRKIYDAISPGPEDDGEIVDPFGTGDPDEMAHCQHGYGREM